VQIQQIVVPQVHQGTQGLALAHGQARRVALEKAIDEQIVFQ
jgi:hypothetical protein